MDDYFIENKYNTGDKKVHNCEAVTLPSLTRIPLYLFLLAKGVRVAP